MVGESRYQEFGIDTWDPFGVDAPHLDRLSKEHLSMARLQWLFTQTRKKRL